MTGYLSNQYLCCVCLHIIYIYIYGTFTQITAEGNCKSELQKRTAKANCRSELQKRTAEGQLNCEMNRKRKME